MSASGGGSLLSVVAGCFEPCQCASVLFCWFALVLSALPLEVCLLGLSAVVCAATPTRALPSLGSKTP